MQEVYPIYKYFLLVPKSFAEIFLLLGEFDYDCTAISVHGIFQYFIKNILVSEYDKHILIKFSVLLYLEETSINERLISWHFLIDYKCQILPDGTYV